MVEGNPSKLGGKKASFAGSLGKQGWGRCQSVCMGGVYIRGLGVASRKEKVLTWAQKVLGLSMPPDLGLVLTTQSSPIKPHI